MPLALSLFFVILFGTICGGFFLGNVFLRLKIRHIVKALKESRGFTYSRNILAYFLPARGVVGDFTFSITRFENDGTARLNIKLYGPTFLPASLVIGCARSRNLLPEELKDVKGLTLDGLCFRSMDVILGREVFGAEMNGWFEDIDAYAETYLFFKNSACLVVLLRAMDRDKIWRIVSAMAGLARRLREHRSRQDLVRLTLNCKARLLERDLDSLKCLRLLAKKYRQDLLTRETFQLLVKGNHYRYGMVATEGLGIDPFVYIRSHFDRLGIYGRVRAIRDLANLKTGAAADFLIELFHHPLHRDVLLELVATFAALPKKGLPDMYVKAVQPLYRLSEDKTRSRWIREAAEHALLGIRNRMGDRAWGWLSLSGVDQGDGGLSLAAKTKQQNKKPTRK